MPPRQNPAVAPQPWPQGPNTTLRRRVRTWLGRLIDGVAIALLVLVAVAVVIATRDHFAQSASVPVTIVQMEPSTWRAGKRAESGHAITYRFTVDGETYHDTENRTWLDVLAAHPKVCYDPAYPDGSHFLAQEGYACAGWNPFEDFGQFARSRDGT
jgi:hypothetical protein